MLVREDEATVALDLDRGDARGAEVELGREDRLAHRLEVARLDADLVALAHLEDEEVELLGEAAVEVVADEAEVVLLAHHLARAREAVLLDDVLPEREAEVVGIDGERGFLARGEWAHDVRVC